MHSSSVNRAAHRKLGCTSERGVLRVTSFHFSSFSAHLFVSQTERLSSHTCSAVCILITRCSQLPNESADTQVRMYACTVYTRRSNTSKEHRTFSDSRGRNVPSDSINHFCLYSATEHRGRNSIRTSIHRCILSTHFPFLFQRNCEREDKFGVSNFYYIVFRYCSRVRAAFRSINLAIIARLKICSGENDWITRRTAGVERLTQFCIQRT